ncbi:MAG: hypothetical protein GX575_26120 [Candidatus Anammoximicrobium sp.]|mgnify:CR=1 FL=1|nr:hypothetical protein [Candidatus Anammoximicrobium sp.]
MNAAKRKAEPQPAGFVAWLSPFSQRPARRLLAVLLLVAGLLGSVFYGWQRMGPQIVQGPEYELHPDQIQIPPPPPWVRSDIRAETVRDGGLTGLSILDRDLTVKIARAFSLHTWVEDVRRVKKEHPARVIVELVYRRPVAMVEVTMNERPGLLPVDLHGVLLPPGDFSAEQARDYLRISLPDATPTGPVGTPWGDPRVDGAARIAAVLSEHWKQLGLYRIAVEPGEAAASAVGEVTFVLSARRGAQVVWGAAPPSASGADAKASLAKVERLVAYVEQHGPLDGLNPDVHIDLTQIGAADPRTAQLPARDE